MMYGAIILVLLLLAANASEAFLTSRWTSGALPSSSSTSYNDRATYHKSMSKQNKNNDNNSQGLSKNTAWVRDLVSSEEKIDKEGTYLPLPAAKPQFLNERNELSRFKPRPDGSVRFVVRDFYSQMADEIVCAFVDGFTLRVFVTGTPGTGKTTFRNYVAWKLLRKWKAKGIGGAVVMHKGGTLEYTVFAISAEGEVDAWEGDRSEMAELTEQYELGENLFCLTDVSLGDTGGTEELDGGLVLFSSPNPKTWAQGGKANCKFFFMPLWKLEELMYLDPNTPIGKLIEERFFKYGGLARYVWGSEKDVKVQEDRLTSDKFEPFEQMEDKLTGRWDGFPDRFIHLHVKVTEDGKYLFTEFPTAEIASVYIARKLAGQYVQQLLKLASPTFGKSLPAVFGLLFEAIVLNLLGINHTFCRLEIKKLTQRGYGRNLPANLIKSGKPNLLILGEQPARIVDFNNEIDVVAAITANLSTLALGLPRSSTFAGFDGTFVVPSLRSASLPTLILPQATTRPEHPLSNEGLKLLEDFAGSRHFSNIVILYIVPDYVYERFEVQKLKNKNPTPDEKKSFEVAQYCMRILPNQPTGQSNQKETTFHHPPEEKKRASKDKNAPKGARGSFILFSTDKRSEVLTGTPGMALEDVAKALGVRWKAISAEERAVYKQRAKEDKVRYANEMQAYNVKKNST